MNVMSFNTQHCKSYLGGKIDFDLMAGTIKKCGADIVGLNEMRGAGISEEYTDQTKKLAELCGMHYYFAKAIDVPSGGPYGNALLSRYPIESAVTIPVPDPEARIGGGYYESRCLLKAKLSCGITVLVIHFGLNADEQKNAADTVLENLESEKCILMGDFNVMPENGVLNPIRARLFDTAKLFDEPKLSFDSVSPTRKIDYIFVTPDIKVLSADIPAITASDHRPHTAVIEI